MKLKQGFFAAMAKRSKDEAMATRDQLIDAATKLFSEQGYKDTSVNQISAEAGTTKGALFHHFPSKDSIFRAVWDRLQISMDQEARDAAIAARGRDDPYSAFLAGCKVYLKWASRRDYQQIVLIDGPSVLGVAGWYEDDHNLGNENVMAGVRYLAKKGLVSEGRVRSYAVMIQSALNGCGFALSRNEPGITTDSIFGAFEEMLRALR